MLLAVAATTERSARDLAAAIRARELSAREVVEAHAWRLHNCQPRTNALACDRFADGLAEAEAADERIAAAGPDDELPPFLGVPCTIKESIALRGMPNCAGMVALRDRRSETTAPGGAAADRRRLHPARRDEHVGADDVDRVRQPRLRPHPQRL